MPPTIPSVVIHSAIKFMMAIIISVAKIRKRFGSWAGKKLNFIPDGFCFLRGLSGGGISCMARLTAKGIRVFSFIPLWGLPQVFKFLPHIFTNRPGLINRTCL